MIYEIKMRLIIQPKITKCDKVKLTAGGCLDICVLCGGGGGAWGGACGSDANGGGGGGAWFGCFTKLVFEGGGGGWLGEGGRKGGCGWGIWKKSTQIICSFIKCNTQIR